MEWAQLCKLAYEEPLKVYRAIPSAIPMKCNGEVAGYMTKEGRAIIVFLKGTNSLADVFEDVKFTTTPFHMSDATYGRVHEGFYNEFINLKMYLLRNGLNTCSKIILTGHSMGAAVVTLMGLYCAVVFRKPVEVYTFGSPKVGDADFVHAFDTFVSKSDRYLHKEDPIPRLPTTCCLQYHHVKGGLCIEEDKIVKKDSCRFLCCIFDCLECCFGCCVRGDHNTHSIDSYLESLNAISHT